MQIPSCFKSNQLFGGCAMILTKGVFPAVSGGSEEPKHAEAWFDSAKRVRPADPHA